MRVKLEDQCCNCGTKLEKNGRCPNGGGCWIGVRGMSGRVTPKERAAARKQWAKLYGKPAR